MKMRKPIVLLLAAVACCLCAGAQNNDDDDEDIWRHVDLNELDYQRSKSYCQRLYCYYRFIDDGMEYITTREKDMQKKLYRVYEGICELDIRYDKDEDEGAEVMVGRNLVHPDEQSKFIDFYELKPYTFLEKARKTPRHFTLETRGDSTLVYTKRGLAGTAYKDTENQLLYLDYNAIAPDTTVSVNLLIVKARLNRAHAKAVYWYDETTENYVPQGNLKHIFFDGDMEFNSPSIGGKSVKEVFNEYTEIYVDSVAYLTRDEYKADRRTTLAERRKRCGYTDADIDRLKQKFNVSPLTPAQLGRIEEQRDWDEQYEQWRSKR